MKIIHDSRNTDYRKPFGAIETGTLFTLSLRAEDCDVVMAALEIRRDEEKKYHLIRMQKTGEDMYSASLTAPDHGCLLLYRFSLTVRDGEEEKTVYYCNNEDGLGGLGRVPDPEDDRNPYQITVYRKAEVPEWYKDGIVYQIFPGRFSRDEAWRERCEAAIRTVNTRRTDTRRVIQEDWNKAAYYRKDSKGKVTEWPIYGGSLKGIEEKLDYIKSLGATVIYLNPVFEATSNHRYDTADYMKIDPVLGTNEDFSDLCRAAEKRGIRIILDGVFSHTGADSIYFDRYENYGNGNGAWANEDSPYRSWFKFDENEACGYKSWWGVEDLPEVDENDPDYREFILGENGVAAYWLKMGASGWRLDVADELPDSFIREIRTRIKTVKPDALLLGEVWEDASNKISYGERRRYFMGEELDSTMNYPVRDVLLDYVNYTISSGKACDRLMSLAENYPRENFYGALNLIGSHDRERIITAMAAKEDYKSAVNKVKLLSSLQYTLPGVPCLYYGDEAGLMGGTDPENRSGYPWGFENLDLGYHYRMLGLIYEEHPVLKGGEFTFLSGKDGINDDVFAFLRSNENEKILTLANRSYGSTEIDLRGFSELKCGYAVDLLTSEELKPDENGSLGKISMERLSSRIILLLEKPPHTEEIEKSCGVVCHISSLGQPVLGQPAADFVDYLAFAGFGIWQVLPLNPTGTGGSPYSSHSAFAGNPDFINREELPDKSGYAQFCRENMGWLSEYAAYTVLKEMHDGKPWTEWAEQYRNADPEEVLKGFTGEQVARANELVFDQYWFSTQWKELKRYAHRNGVRMMGDLPMYMALDSADVWANKGIFRMNEDGRLSVHAGVPPDAFSSEGQDWGNPLYDWDKLKTDGYSWWLRRLKQCAERFDILRIDHFRGMSEYFAIPDGKTPKSGVWQHSAGLEFFRAVKKMLRDEKMTLRLLAEDLGFLDAGVKNLLKLTGLPGMDIWQFTSDEMLAMKPAEAARRAFYTGTHDNNTLIGFLKDQEKGGEKNPAHLEAEAKHIIEQIYESPAALAMVQLQDIFLLDEDARMNVPGVAEGNWGWKMPKDSVEESYPEADGRAVWFRELAEKTGRH